MNNKLKYFLASATLATSLLGISVFPALAQSDINDAQCEAIYINNTPVPNGGTYPNPIKIGDKFHAEIKMKNTGQTSWTKDQNYKLGISLGDNNSWGTNRIELPSNNSISPTQDVIFTYDFAVSKIINGRIVNPGTYDFPWQMLRERTVDNSGNVIDAGGRFGQACHIKINLVAADSPIPSIVTPKTTCIDTDNNLQKIQANWNKVSGASSYQATLYSTGGAVEQGKCVAGGITEAAFTKSFDASKNYTVSVASYSDANCTSLINTSTVTPVINGVAGMLNSTNILKSVSFDLGTGTNIPYPLNSCAPVKLHLTPPTNSFDIPIKVSLSTSNPGKGPGEVQNNLFNYPFTVIFKYQPADSNNND